MPVVRPIRELFEVLKEISHSTYVILTESDYQTYSYWSYNGTLYEVGHVAIPEVAVKLGLSDQKTLQDLYDRYLNNLRTGKDKGWIDEYNEYMYVELRAIRYSGFKTSEANYLGISCAREVLSPDTLDKDLHRIISMHGPIDEITVEYPIEGRSFTVEGKIYADNLGELIAKL